MNNQEGKKEIDPFSEAAIRFRAGEDAVFQSIYDARALQAEASPNKGRWAIPGAPQSTDIQSIVNSSILFSEDGMKKIMSGEYIWDPTLGAFIDKEQQKELYGRPEKTPVEKRKLRNACLSGHMTGEEKKCVYCRQARFYTITSGYHGDMPELDEVEKILRQTEQTEDRKFVLEYLELPEDATFDQISAFLIKMVWLDKLVMWGKRTGSQIFAVHPFSRNMVALAPPYHGKSGFVAGMIRDHQVIRDIYAAAHTFGVEEFSPGSYDVERLLKSLNRPDGKGKTAVAKGMFPPDQRTVTINPRRPGRNTLNAAIADTLSKKFAGVDPATDPAKVVVVDSLGGFTPAAVGDTHGYVINKSPMKEPTKKPPSKLMQALMQRFHKKDSK